ncbi:hypothetical protein Tco_1532492 [Tanacetum coccineum]
MSNYIQQWDRPSASNLKHVPELTTGSSKRDAEVELDHEGSKKQKTNEASGSVQEQPEEEETYLPQEDLQQMMMAVPVEEFYVESLQVKYPIIDCEVYYKDTRMYWRIIKVGNHTEAYQIFTKMLKKFYRHDLVKLWDLVRKAVQYNRAYRFMLDPLVWRLYDICGVYHVSSLLVEQHLEMANELFKENLHTSKHIKTIKCLEASSQHRWFNSEKLIDLDDNHKFRGGLLGLLNLY